MWGSREGKLDPAIQEGTPPDPPPPPRQDKLWRIDWHQVVGLLVMVSIVVAALAGWLGTTTHRSSVRGNGLIMEIVAAETLRYRLSGPIEITVTNVADTPTSVSVQVARSYLERFGDVSFTPAADSLDERWYTFDLGVLEPGNSAGIDGQLEADAIGRHRGIIRIAGVASLDVSVSTLTFP